MFGPAKPDDLSKPQPIGGALFSTVALVGIALISDYLLQSRDKASETPSIVPREGPHADEAEARGRQATTPSEIPPQGWKDILLRVFANISKHRVLALAAGMTYYSILAIFPAIAALVAVYGLFSDPTTIMRHLDQMGGCLAAPSMSHASN